MKRDASPTETIIVYGASGHAKVVVDIIERAGKYTIGFIADDNPALKGQMIYGYRVLGGKYDILTTNIRKAVVAIGSNRARAAVSTWLKDNGFLFVTAVHPTAAVARGARVGIGTVLMAGSIVNSDAAVGDHVIVNTGATIDHDCRIGNFVHIAPGSTLCGSVKVGDGSFVCAGATVVPNLTIGSNVIVGAGATVITDVEDSATVIGTPAIPLNKREVK